MVILFCLFLHTCKTNYCEPYPTAGDDDPGSLRALMSCGHAVTSQSLTAWCRSLLDRVLFSSPGYFPSMIGSLSFVNKQSSILCVLILQQQYEFTCPALVNGINESCGKKWPYIEIRKIALLTDEEQAHFEEILPQLAAARYCEFKSVSIGLSYIHKLLHTLGVNHAYHHIAIRQR